MSREFMTAPPITADCITASSVIRPPAPVNKFKLPELVERDLVGEALRFADGKTAVLRNVRRDGTMEYEFVGDVFGYPRTILNTTVY